MYDDAISDQHAHLGWLDDSQTRLLRIALPATGKHKDLLSSHEPVASTTQLNSSMPAHVSVRIGDIDTDSTRLATDAQWVINPHVAINTPYGVVHSSVASEWKCVLYATSCAPG